VSLASLREEALLELVAAARRYEETREGLGERLIQEAEDCVQALAQRPGLGHPIAGPDGRLGARRLSLRSFPYHLVYLAEPELAVIAVAHDRKRPGYWANRLQDS